MARAISEIHGTVTKTERGVKWVGAIVLAAVLANLAINYSSRATLAPASAAAQPHPEINVHPPAPAGQH
jgi:hypothetical protein